MDPNMSLGTDSSLNLTARSSAIQTCQRCQWCSWPNRRRRPFGLKSVLVGQCPVRHGCQTTRIKLIHSASSSGYGQKWPHVLNIYRYWYSQSIWPSESVVYSITTHFEWLHRFYSIRREMGNKLPLITKFPCTLCPIFGHYQGYVYIAKVMWPLCVHDYFICVERFFILVCCRSIAQHLKNIPAQKVRFRKFLPKTQYENSKITKKNYWFAKCSISERINLNSIESILNPVIMYLNVFSYCYKL